MFLGDLNVLEPDHQPRYKFFAPFEYDFYRQLTDGCGLIDTFRALHPEKIEHSWVGRTGDGYRYDHIHCTADLAATLVSCDYLHQARVDRLSGHSALSVRLAIEPSEPLITSPEVTTATDGLACGARPVAVCPLIAVAGSAFRRACGRVSQGDHARIAQPRPAFRHVSASDAGRFPC
jgi:hypothetical protein